MAKWMHEIRDPIHNFVRISTDERGLVDSPPFQRLRHIHQLGMSHFIYPGANHTRFEHSLGVMELATRIYETVTDRNLAHDALRDVLPADEKRGYWRQVVRLAALCHDLGHLPFSHAAERAEYDHECITYDMIAGETLADVWGSFTPPVKPEHIAKVALGQRKYSQLRPTEGFSDLEAVLSEVIAGDAFGADRMDYLLRDAHHLGVAYGRFDHYRLVDTIRILPQPPSRCSDESSNEPHLGVEEGGLHTAESLLLARYFMFQQVYYHHVRRAYDMHLKEFLLAWRGDAGMPVSPRELMLLTDNEVMAAIWHAAHDASDPCHEHARRIVQRQHFRKVYSPSPQDTERNPEARQAVHSALTQEYGEGKVREDYAAPKGAQLDFPVERDDRTVASSVSLSHVLAQMPPASAEYVLVAPEVRSEAEAWVGAHLDDILTSHEGGLP